MFDKKDKSITNEIVETVGISTVVIAALIVIFAREYSWVIIFTTLILCFFGIVSTKETCCKIEKPIVKETTKPKKK